MNNANFGFDCRNNANTKFEPIINEIREITYIKKYNLFDSQIANFVKSDILEQRIWSKKAIIKENDPFKVGHIAEIENE